MSKRPPIRRISTRKAPPAAVAIELKTEGDESFRESEQETEDAVQTEDVPQQTEPEREDSDSLTEGSEAAKADYQEDPPPTQADVKPETPTPSEITTAASLIASTTPTPSSSKKRRSKKTKEDLFKEYMFGIHELEDVPERDDVSSYITQRVPPFRMNRTYDMRKNCNARRINLSRKMALDEIGSVEEQPKRNLGFIPKNVFRQPKIPVRPTLGSKFRYLYNRRPQGVKVYFKNVKADPKDRPPFVSATRV